MNSNRNMNKKFVTPKIDIYKFKFECTNTNLSDFNFDIDGDGEGWDAADE